MCYVHHLAPIESSAFLVYSSEVQVIVSFLDWATLMKKFNTEAGLCVQTREDDEPCLVPLPSWTDGGRRSPQRQGEGHIRCRKIVRVQEQGVCDLCAVFGVQINMGMQSHILCILEMASLSLKTILHINMIVPMLWSRVKKIRYATTDFFFRWSSSPFYNSDVPWLNVLPSFHLNTDSFS